MEKERASHRVLVCPRCGHALIRVDYYDPEGAIPINTKLKDQDGNALVCVDCPN